MAIVQIAKNVNYYIRYSPLRDSFCYDSYCEINTEPGASYETVCKQIQIDLLQTEADIQRNIEPVNLMTLCQFASALDTVVQNLSVRIARLKAFLTKRISCRMVWESLKLVRLADITNGRTNSCLSNTHQHVFLVAMHNNNPCREFCFIVYCSCTNKFEYHSAKYGVQHEWKIIRECLNDHVYHP